MKTYLKTFSLILALSVATMSCKKDVQDLSEPVSPITEMKSAKGDNLLGGVTSGFTDLVTSVTDKLYCSAKEVPLCAGQTANAGRVSVQTAIDGKTYVTYTLTGQWKIKELHLYAGSVSGLPVTNSGNPIPGQFPLSVTYTAPYNVQRYTFVLENMPTDYIVAAHAAILKINSQGTILDSQTGWGDGCTGKKINDDGQWGTFFNYSSSTCTLASALIEEVPTCSRSVATVTGVDPLYNSVIAWSYPEVEVGGYTYSETEAREIADCPDAGKTTPDSKFAFTRVATLRQSNTDIAASAVLSPAVLTIESWLVTKGKLSKDNLPTGNSAVKNAAMIIDEWIGSHVCQGRR